MNQKPMVMNKVTMVNATHRAKDSVEYYRELGRALQEDPDHGLRLVKQECMACYYCRSRMGGSAITIRPCMSCGEEMVFGSTCTDVLCLKCAREGDLCKRCGADFGLRERRRNWPSPKI